MKACVYILKDDNGRFYIGISKNIKRRMLQHLSKPIGYSAKMKNPRLVLLQEFDSITLARKVEIRLKVLKRKDYINRIVQDGYIKLSERVK